MCCVLKRVEADATDPLADKASVLACGQVLIWTATAGKQALTELSTADLKIVIQCLPGYFGELKPNGPASLALPDVGAINRVAVGCHVIDAKRNEITAAQLAIDGEIEERQVPYAPLKLQLGAYGPDMADSQWRLWASELAFGAYWLA